MSYIVQESYDSRIPSSPGNGWPFVAIVCHDTEGGQGLAGARGTKQFFIDRADRNASYHEIWWYHEQTDEFGVLKIVPKHRAAHSINPNQPPNGPYDPDRWVRQILGSYWWNPNQAVYAVSIAGKVRDVDRYARNPKFLAHAQRRMLELWKELGITNRAEHFRFQPGNRSDWGQLLMPALGGLVTSDRPALPDTATENPMAIELDKIKGIVPTAMTLARHANIRLEPNLDGEPWENTGDRDITVTAVGRVWGQAWPEGSTDHYWFCIILADGGLRFVHQSQIVSRVRLGLPVEADCSAQEATIREQADRIAGLMTDLSQATAAKEAAEALVAPSQALKAALTDFMG